MPTTPDALKAFTIKSDKIENRLQTPVTIINGSQSIEVPALWDTGATCSCISYDTATRLGLVATGKRRIATPSGTTEVNTYLVSITLPNNVNIGYIPVCDSDIGRQGLGALIGMDIISSGDFSVSNFNGKTVFTFRTPSHQLTDYVQQIVVQNAMGKKHGRGKRK